MVECDAPTVDVLQHNVREVEGESICTIINSRVDGHPIELNKPIDMAIMNPPWGVQTLGADRVFFETLFSMKIPLIHFIHSINAEHLLPLAHENGYELHSIYQDDFRLPASYAHPQKTSPPLEFDAIVLRRRIDANPCEGLKREQRSHPISTRYRYVGCLCSELKL